MMRIGVTGGIAEGKSTVLGYCKEAGYPTLSSDDLARDVFHSPAVQSQLAELLACELPVSRDLVRSKVGENPGFRRALNRIMHPAIVEEIRSADAEIVEVPLLIEACLTLSFDEIWVVTCGPDEQRRRLNERLGEAEADALLCTQLPTSAKLPFADFIVRTNQPESHVCSFVLSRVEKVLSERN